MNRLATWVAVLVVPAAGPACGCQQRPDPLGANPALPVAPPPRPKIPAVVLRSVRPPDDTAVANRAWVFSYGLTRRDLEAIGQLPGIAEVIPARFIPSDAKHRERVANVRVVATVAGYAALHWLETSAGRFLTAEDDRDLRNVCVLSSAAAGKLFPDVDPVGKTVTIRSFEFSVVGVLKESAFADPDSGVYVPLGTSRARFGDVIRTKEKEAEKVEFHEVVIRTADGTDPTKTADAVRELLGEIHPGKDWEVTTR
jgi:putative ABC transport system permease protein